MYEKKKNENKLEFKEHPRKKSQNPSLAKNVFIKFLS